MNLQQPPVLLQSRSAGELELWLRALLTCLDLLYPSENRTAGHELVLGLYPGQKCTACGRRLAGLLGQGYTCRACQAVLHKACIADLTCPEPAGPMRRTGSIAIPVFNPDRLVKLVTATPLLQCCPQVLPLLYGLHPLPRPPHRRVIRRPFPLRLFSRTFRRYILRIRLHYHCPRRRPHPVLYIRSRLHRSRWHLL